MIFIRNIDRLLNRKIAPHFRAYEFVCGCGRCFLTFVHPTGLALLSELRDRYGAMILFTSAYRCQCHNRSMEVGGTPYSYHPRGMAWDILLPDNIYDAEFLIGLCKEIFPYFYVGNGFVHVDCRGHETENF